MLDNLIQSGNLLVVFALLICGFILLIRGADIFVDGSSSIAKRFGVPSIIIGLTIVAMGTSLPEAAVSATASMAGNNELAISNAIGSNIFNMMVVIGASALLSAINVADETIKRDIPISAICAVLLIVMGAICYFATGEWSLSRPAGVVLLVLFTFYIIYLVRTAISGKSEATEDTGKVMSPIRALVLIFIGGFCIFAGGNLTVDSASRIAAEFGMSQTLIGLTIVSIGTSLPELVTSIVAARKNEVDLALGNAIGSNVFNIMMVLGIASSISPIAIIRDNIVDIAILLIFTLVVWLFAYTKKSIGRMEGLIMLLLYAGFFVYAVVR